MMPLFADSNTATKTERSGFTFDASKHEYRLDGQVLPSVTQVLRGVGMIDYSMIPQVVLQEAARIGTLAHKALHYLDDGDLDEATVAPELTGYIEAYRRFLSESGFEPVLVEHRVFHRIYRYAGTPDRTGTFPDGSMAVVDFKTGLVMPGHALQLAAYANCLKHPRQYRRIALQLFEDGSYRVHEYPQKDFYHDVEVFLSALACWNWQVINDTGRAA